MAAALIGVGCGSSDDEVGPPETADGAVDARADASDGARNDAAADGARPGDGSFEAAADAPTEAPEPSCTDGIKNGPEADVDCGGSCPTKCDRGKTCIANSDCKDGLCTNDVCGECIDPSTCPAPDGECKTSTCVANACGMGNSPADTSLTTQVAGDCKSRVCDGNGAVTSANDDADLPVDGKACTEDKCLNGTPSNPSSPSGTLCDEGGGHVCDGSGACVACNLPAECPGQDTECQARTCVAHVCGFDYAAATKTLSSQTAGDCHVLQCNGSGGIVSNVDDNDLPIDGNECTQDLCSGGVASNPAVVGGSPCSGGLQCTGTICGECNVPADCPAEDGGVGGDCHHRTCDAHKCGAFNDPPGAVAPTQTPGDCHVNHCNASGGVVVDVDDSDLPVDNNDCTQDLCAAGAPSNPVRPAGTVCAQAQGGRCADPAVCVPTFMVLRVGDGSAALSNKATPVFVERRYLDAVGAMAPGAGNPIALPTTSVDGSANQPLTLSGTTTRDGVLSLSTNGLYVSLVGYGATLDTTGNISSSQTAAVNRIVGRIDANNNVDTSTRLDAAFNGNNVRSAASIDGSAFWVGGAGGTTGGVFFIPLGATGGVQVLDDPQSVRAALVFGGQLYASSGDNDSVFAVGTGTPTSGIQTATAVVTGIPSPNSFVFFDRDSGVPGLDTLYVAEDDGVGTNGGIQKWTLSGTTWSLATRFTLDNAGAQLSVGIRQVTGVVQGNAVTLIATSAETSGNRILKYVDDGGSANPTPTLLATAPANTGYRGVALAP